MKRLDHLEPATKALVTERNASRLLLTTYPGYLASSMNVTDLAPGEQIVLETTMQRDAFDESADHGPEITSLLLEDDRRLLSDLRFVARETDAWRRRELFWSIVRAITSRDAITKVAVYPVLSHRVGGAELRREALREQRVIMNELVHLYRHLAWHPGGRGSRHRIERFADRLELLYRFEEDELLPLILTGEAEQKRNMMGTWAGIVQRFAPTRPHPHGPQRLPGLLSVGLLLALLDRLRDVARRLAYGR